MKKTVVIINDFAFLNGGAGKVAFTAAKALPSMGVRTILFSAVPPVDKSLEEAGVEVICLNQYDILNSPSRLNAVVQGVWNKTARQRFSELLDTLDESSTIIHFHGWSKALSASMWNALIGRNFEVIVTLHEYFLFCPNLGLYNYRTKKICDIKPSSLKCYFCNCDARSYPQKLWRSFRQLVQWHQLRRNKKINLITIGKTNRMVSEESIRDYVKKIYFLQNPIDLAEEGRTHVEENDTYIFMGRLSSEKGVDHFCEAITSLNLKGCVIGDGYLKDSLMKQYPNIPFVGWKEGADKMEILKRAKALVFPSLWYEGAPLTIIEMHSLGIPCIVPDRCAASEFIQEGVNGFVFSIGNLSALKDAIRKCEVADLKPMSEKMYSELDRDSFTTERHIQSLMDIYNDVLASRES